MADPRDDRVSRAYREMPGDGPGPALDAAVLAAARRAVGSRPGVTRRWQVPVSIAAVLALAVGVSLNVEREKPLVVDGTPVSPDSAEYPVSLPAPEAEEPAAPGKPASAPAEPSAATAAKNAAAVAREVAPVAKEMAPAKSATRAKSSGVPAGNSPRTPDRKPSLPAAPAARLEESAPVRDRQPAAVPEAKRFAPDPPRAAPPQAATMAPATVASPAAVAGSSLQSAPAAAVQPDRANAAAKIVPRPAASPFAAGAVAPTDAASARPQEGGRVKSESTRDSAAQEKRSAEAAEAPGKALERIADLRARGLHDEADRALAQFRRAHPDYRIGEEWLRRIERR